MSKALQELIDELEGGHLNAFPGMAPGSFNAHLINKVFAATGCLEIAKDCTLPGDGEGTMVLIALMYQNLILARRIETLEAGGSRRV